MANFAKGFYMHEKQTEKGIVLKLSIKQEDGTYKKYNCWRTNKVDKYNNPQWNVYIDDYKPKEGYKPMDEEPF